MTVVSLKAVRDATLPSRQVTVYCVQAFWRDRKGLTKGQFQQFQNMESALRKAKAAAIKSAAVQVYYIRGYVGSDVWSEPHTVAWFGDRG